MSEARRFGLLHIVGTGKTSATPDQVVVNFTVNASHKKSQSESAALQAKKFAEVKSALVKAGAIAGLNDHKNLCSTNFGFGAEYEWVGNNRSKKRLVGFNATQSVTLRLSRELGGVTVDALARSGAEVESVTFEISNYAELRMQALDLAIKNAKETAEARAKDLGVTVDLTNVYEYRENADSGVGYTRAMKAALSTAGGGGESPDLAAGERDVAVSVSVTYMVQNNFGALKFS